MATLLKEPRMRVEDRAHAWEVPVAFRNVGGYERGARLIIGAAAAIGMTRVEDSLFALVALCAVAAIGLLTGTLAYCPINRAAGRDSFHPSGADVDARLGGF